MTFRATRPSRAPTVLVVDDDRAVRGSVADILRREGYAVTEADDLAAALFGTVGFDALVLDDRLPGRDALAVLAALESPPPAVLVSAHDLDPMGRKELAVRGIAHLHKPVDPEHLLDAVATAVRRSRTPVPDGAD